MGRKSIVLLSLITLLYFGLSGIVSCGPSEEEIHEQQILQQKLDEAIKQAQEQNKIIEELEYQIQAYERTKSEQQSLEFQKEFEETQSEQAELERQQAYDLEREQARQQLQQLSPSDRKEEYGIQMNYLDELIVKKTRLERDLSLAVSSTERTAIGLEIKAVCESIFRTSDYIADITFVHANWIKNNLELSEDERLEKSEIWFQIARNHSSGDYYWHICK